MSEYREGHVGIEEGNNYWSADIDRIGGLHEHYGVIQCYGLDKEAATGLRDRVLAGFHPPTNYQISMVQADLWNEVGHKSKALAKHFGMAGWHRLVSRVLKERMKP